MKENFNINEFKALESQKLDLLTPIETKTILKNNPFVIEPDYLTTAESIRIFGIGKKPDPFIADPLPESYMKRTFFRTLSALTYKLEELPGHIVKYDEATETYSIASPEIFIEDAKPPEAILIEDGLIYSAIINSGASINGTFLIGGLNVDSKSIMELIIQDVIMSIVPSAVISIDKLAITAKGIPKSERKNYFFIKGTTLTIINNRRYKEQKFDAKVNATYVTVEGKVFASNDKFSRERMVSVDLISLDDILKLKKKS